MPIAPGTRLGPYEVQETIGQGAMGVVYRAYHAQLERTGAVKVLQALSPDQETTARFRREAQAIAHMRHPNVLNVFDFGDFEGTPYMIVEYVEGGSLSARMKRADLDTASALHYLRGIASALDYAHSLGIVHRDVKPANVLLGPGDTPILADFGLAKLLQSSSIKSITGVTTGTPAYMAPEQVSGDEVGPAADRYSLAVMAFEMLSGALPFDDAGVLEVLYAHVHREPPKPSARNAGLAGPVDAIVLRGLAKKPEARWETCDAFVSALEEALGHPSPGSTERTVAMAPPMPATNGRGHDASAVAATVAVAEPPAPRPAAISQRPEPEPERRPARRLVFWLGAVVLVLLLLLGGTAAFLWNRAPAIEFSQNPVAPGERLVLIANHVPSDQIGEFQIHSALHTFSFQSDSGGHVSQEITVPVDIALGDHRVDLCWNGACRASKVLHVQEGVAQAPIPTPSTQPAASPTPSASPSPGVTPKATPTTAPAGTPTPRAGGGSSPTPTHAPSPSPSSNPCPTPTSGAQLKGPASAVGGTTITLTGTNFTPNKVVTLKYYLGSSATAAQAWTVTASCAGGFSTSLKTSGGVTRTDHVTATDSAGRTASVSFGILL